MLEQFPATLHRIITQPKRRSNPGIAPEWLSSILVFSISRVYPLVYGEESMNVMRYTVVDAAGTVSFVGPCEATQPLVAACAENPETLERLLEIVDRYFPQLRDEVLSGLAVFDEHNANGVFNLIHAALDFLKPHELPAFRVVDGRTSSASLQPVKAGLIIFNLPAKRIVQVQNSYIEIQRSGRLRVRQSTASAPRVLRYQLPKDWSLVP